MEIVQISKDELKELIREVIKEEMEKFVQLLEDMFLTPEEKKLLEEVKEKIINNDYSDFISVEDVKL